MSYLFFIVHPSKYHLFKHTINTLKREGHTVDILIITKDVLEDLVKSEGWEYTNLFPEGRRSKDGKAISIYYSTFINFFKTLIRLWIFTKGKKYDLFITDDLLTILGSIKRVQSLMFIDDDLSYVKLNSIIYFFADKIITPINTDLKWFNSKKISINSFKELASVHPKYFQPDQRILVKYDLDINKYIVVRLVSLTASHDILKKGITDEDINELLKLCDEKKIKLVISSERVLDSSLEKYRLKISPLDLKNILFYSLLYIGDSQTMSSEAALMGVPSLRYNDFVGKINSMEDIEQKYNLSFGFHTNNFGGLLLKVRELIYTENLKDIWISRRNKMLEQTIDINEFFISYFKEYLSNNVN